MKFICSFVPRNPARSLSLHSLARWAGIHLLLSGLLFMGTVTAGAAEGLRITEFLANNFHGLVDEDGDSEDWIEIHNGGTEDVNLNGWYLTDSKSSLKKWRFPAITLPAAGYRVIFASGKDRPAVLGSLHTSFKLSSKEGSYLGLVASDGVTVVSEYSGYPAQVANVSYGFPILENVVPLLSSTNRARILVPSDDLFGKAWTTPDFSDVAWTSVSNGFGYETDSRLAINPVTLADSVKEFSGNQGANNWFYGYWDRRNDADGRFSSSEFQPFPRSAGVLSAANFFTNSLWRWFPTADAPTQLDRYGAIAGGHNGLADRAHHWAVRRWISETVGSVRISGMVGHASSCSDAALGDEVTARILVDGVEVFQQSLRQISVGYSVTVTVANDASVDFVIDPGAAGDDACDSAVFTVLIQSTAPSMQILADSVADWSEVGDQGYKNWSYGFYDRSADSVSGYQTNDFALFPDAFWDGFSWSWLAGTPPYDTVGKNRMKPTGVTSGGEHWVIRRWYSKVTGTLSIDYHVGKAVSGGGGVTAKVLHKGTQKDSVSILGNNIFGTNRTFQLTGVQLGDPIDFVLDPAGPSGADDALDESFLDARVFGNANLAPFVLADIKSSLQGINGSVYARLPFSATNPAALETLSLRLRYDSGFIAYLNGVEVLRRNAPSDPAWNSVSTLERPDGESGQFEAFDLTASRDVLRIGANVLAFQVLNSSPSDSDLIFQATLGGSYLTIDPLARRYFGVSTPGFANGFGNTNLGPLVLDSQHSPKVPRVSEDLRVTARVGPSFNVVQDVQLVYRVMSGAEVALPMSDDGLHDDGLAGDGQYGATIPKSAYKPGDMVRYFIRAFDVKTNLTREPGFVKGKFMPEYWGTVVQDPSLTNPLPVLHWFASSAGAADGGGAGSIFYNGQFLDNVRFAVHGQSSSGFSKHSWNVDLNAGYKLVWKDGEPSIDDINLLTTYPDKAKMRNVLAYNTYKNAGSPYHFVEPVRVQFNGKFLGDYHFVENGDDNYLKRAGLNPNGSLWKMYNSFESPDGEHKTRKAEGTSDLMELFAGTGRAGAALQAYVYDNLNIPGLINYFAAMTMTGNTDCCHKNYYFYRDTEGTGEWTMLPWDQDLSFGRVWSGPPTYWDDTMYTNTSLRIGTGNRLPVALFAANPQFDQMYLRRLRTLMEELLQVPGTPAHLLRYEAEVDYWTPRLQPEFAADFARWGTFSGDGNGGTQNDNKNKQTVEEAANIIKYEYLSGRRNWLFAQAEIPKGQPADPGLLIGVVESNPASGNQDEEYFTLINTNKVLIDISRWRIQGAVEHEFVGGTVLPTNGILHVVANTRAFRARSVSPRGGERLFVQGNYRGHLSSRGETLDLVDTSGKVQVHHSYSGAPSPAQNSLRITEIMYHPSAPASGSLFTRDDFEYIELRNISSGPLSLAGVKLVNGVEFSFTGSAVSSLAAGQSVVVVKNAAAFTSRYGVSALVAGQYSGSLADSGENIRLEDASHEPILDFDFNNSWYPITDGTGFSLVIVDDTATWDTWGLKTSWRVSGSAQGNPGVVDPVVRFYVPLVISEVLAFGTAEQGGDFVEIFNPSSTAANVGSWFLTDDFGTPKKYRLPANTSIAPGGYLVIRESQYDSGALGSFGISADGDDVYLFSADAAGELTGYVTGYRIGASGRGVSFGRHTNTLGEMHFVAQKSVTPGAPNSGPAVGPVVISEIMYHGLETSAGEQQTALEYIEIKNLTDQSVTLFHPDQPTNTWRLTGGADLMFPTNVTLSARETALLVNFNPVKDPTSRAAFISFYGTPQGVKLFGPLGGKLDNSSESIALYRPSLAPSNAPASYILADWVTYADLPPWPALADGFGAALIKVPSSAYGNDPSVWIAAKPSPGYEDPVTSPPAISLQPTGAGPIAGADVSLSVTAGPEPLSYQWFRDGQPVPGARSRTLSIPSIRVSDWGNYQAVVMNPAGAVLSSNAVVIPILSAVILKQPIGRNMLPGTNSVNFTVTATGSGKLRYQWLYNGLEIKDATNNAFLIKGISQANEGGYRVRVTDDVGPTLSKEAYLAVYDRPQILAQPQPVQALLGEQASFAVSVGGRGPFGYRWQRFSAVRTNEFLSPNPISVFTLRNISLSLTGNYSVIISNIAGASTSSIPALLSVLTDTDADKMPDSWETLYQLNPASAADALLDADGDGVSNLDEYRAGTDPRDPKSFLRITDLSKGGGTASLEFFAQSNRTYTVEFREAIDVGVWQTLTNVLVRTHGRVEKVVDPYPEASGRLYRLASPALVDRPVKTPVILDSPSSVRALRGTPIGISVVASGTGSLSYQWQKNGELIAGATESQLSFGSVSDSDQGSYAVQVSDDAGTVISQTATLVVLEPPAVQQALQDLSVAVGGTARFEVKATGQQPLRYSWIHEGAFLDTKGPVLEIPSVGPQHAGHYTVIVRHTTPNGPVSVELEAELIVR